MWEFASQLPLELRLNGGVRKAVLREIARRRIGEEVAFRKKQGFTIPVERWLATRWKKPLEELASQSALESQGWLQPGSLRAPVAEGIRNRLVRVQLWYLLVLEKWLQRQAAVPATHP